MALYKHVNKSGVSWGIDFYVNGIRIRKMIGRKQDAIDAHSIVRADILRGTLNIKLEKFLNIDKSRERRSKEIAEIKRKLLEERATERSNKKEHLNAFSNWEKYNFYVFEPSSFKNSGFKVPGVYMFILNGTCLYVGMGTLVVKRAKESLREMKKLGENISTIAIRKEKFKLERFTLEQKLIDRLKPKYNKRYPVGKLEQDEKIIGRKNREISDIMEKLEEKKAGEDGRLLTRKGACLDE